MMKRSEIHIGVDWSQDDSETCVVFMRKDNDGTVTLVDGLRGEAAEYVAQLEEENERLQALVDIENTYGHLYLVAMRYIKNEWGEDKYWELFDAVCKHFDTLIAEKKP